MPQTPDRFFINSYFDISRNTNVNIDNFGFDYILNLDLSLYPPFVGMNNFFTIYNYTINQDLTIETINLTLNKDLVKILLTYDFNKYSKNGIIKFDPANVNVYTNSNFNKLIKEPCKFGYRILEIIATKVFGNSEDFVLIDNGIDFYKSTGNCLINQVIDDIANLFNDTTVLNNIMNTYKNNSSFVNVPGTYNFQFYNSIWEFPMFYSDIVAFIDGESTNEFNGPNMGGTEVDNGSYNIPILLRFWGVGGNSPLNVVAVGENLTGTITWNPPGSFTNITAYKINWTGNNSQTFPINEITANDDGTHSILVTNLIGGLPITFTVIAVSEDKYSIESEPSNSIILYGPPSIINNLSGISGYTKTYLKWTPPNNNGANITAYKFFHHITNSSIDTNNFIFISIWLDASDETTITIDNNITTWLDKKNNTDFTSSSLNITYDSTNKLVNFTGTDGYFSFDNSIINNVKRYAFFFVASFSTLSQYIFVKQHNGESSIYLAIGIQMLNQINDGKLYWYNNKNNSYANSNTSLDIDTVYLFTVYFDGTNLNIRINGNLDSSTPGNFSIYDDVNATFSNLGNSSEFPSSNNWNLYEFIYCNSNVSIDNIELVESYLNFKHDLQLDKSIVIDISSNNTYSYNGLIDLNDFIFLNLLEDNKFVIDTSNNLASSLDNLYNSSSYNIEISAINSFGNGTLSNTISLTTGNKLEYPSNLHGIPSLTKFFISWTPPLTANPNDITDFKIYYSEEEITLSIDNVYSYSGYIDFTDKDFNILFDTETFIVDISGNYAAAILNLINDTSYSIQVSALNNNEETLKSNTIILTPKAQPSAPLDLIITPFNNSVTFQWKAPLENGGTDIISYSVSIANTEILDVNTLNYNYPYYSHSILNLSLGNIYTVNIHAINTTNIVGLDISGTFVLATSPLPPTNLTILNTTQKSISFYWNDNIFPPNYNNTYSSYNITLNPSDASGNILINEGNIFHFNNLTANTNYTINISTVDSSGYISESVSINGFTGIKFGSNFYLLNQPYNQFAFIFTPGGLDNIATTDYYLTVFDNNNDIYNLSFGVSFSENAFYDSSNNIWQILIPQTVNLINNNNYTFNIIVYPYTHITNADSNREINISITVPTNKFYIFKISSLDNNVLFNFYPSYLTTSIVDVNNINYNLTILDNSSNIVINNAILTDSSYNLNLLPNNFYTGTLTSNSNTAGYYLSNFSFYNYQITDLSVSFIEPQNENENDFGKWSFNWTTPVEYTNDNFITQSFQIISDISTNTVVFYQDTYQDTSLTLSIYDLINTYGYNANLNYFRITGYWLSDTKTHIISENSLSFAPVITPQPPTNLIISDSNYDYLTISWTPSVYQLIKPQSYTYTNYIITVVSTDSAFISINKVIAFNNISSYLINNLDYGNKYTITISTKDSLNQISTSITISCYTGNKYASDIYLLNQPNNQYLFSFTPGTLDILTTTDYCLNIIDSNNSILGTYIFGATSSGIYNSNYNTWSYLFPSDLNLSIPFYTFNLLVYPTGQDNSPDSSRETNITIQVPTNSYYITNIITSTTGQFLIWNPPFINNNQLLFTVNLNNVLIDTTNNYSIGINLTDNILYNGSITDNNNITDFTFFNYIITDISASFIQPSELVNDLGQLYFSWTKEELNGNDIFINQTIYIKNNQGKYIYTQSCNTNFLNLSVYDLYNLYNYDLSSNTFIIIGRWISDSGTIVVNSNAISFNLPIIEPVIEATNVTTDSITISWNFYNSQNISQYQMLLDGLGFYINPPATTYTFNGLTTNTLYTISIYALDLNNEPIGIPVELVILTL
jgi:hypothetical protein